MATVRVDKKLHDTLRNLAKSEHRPIGEVIEDAIAKYEKDKFWKEMHEGFARLRADPVAWKEYQEDAAVWDAMSNDDFADQEPYFTEDEARHEANATTPFG